jgi:hypothetical protein
VNITKDGVNVSRIGVNVDKRCVNINKSGMNGVNVNKLEYIRNSDVNVTTCRPRYSSIPTRIVEPTSRKCCKSQENGVHISNKMAAIVLQPYRAFHIKCRPLRLLGTRFKARNCIVNLVPSSVKGTFF